MKEVKPLGKRAYGSIAHLIGSRVGSGEHYITEGQVKICTEKTRDKHDLVIVQEKLDGSCVSVANIENRIIPLTRAGYIANTSPYLQHLYFYNWVYENYSRFENMLEEGERVCGEWLAQAHGTRYDLPHEPFVAFDLIRGNTRASLQEFSNKIKRGEFVVPRLIHVGGSMPIEEVKKRLEPSGHGALDPVEGAVWRVERKGAVDFLAKWVRPDKVDGLYLETVTGQPPVWNWQPKK